MMYFIRYTRLILLFVFLCSAVFGYGQTNQSAQTSAQSNSSNVDSTLTNQPMLIVDASTTIKSYPSMEEEMEMYVQLKSETPRAFFFPNPSHGIIWIEHNLGDEATLQVRAQGGALIFEAKKSNAKKLDLTGFDKGHYQIILSKGEKQLARGLQVI